VELRPRLFELLNTLYYGYALEHPVAEVQSITSPLPTIAKYFLMNGLILPPAAVFNVSTLILLLEAEATFASVYCAKYGRREVHRVPRLED
jgi:hypothetical protein